MKNSIKLIFFSLLMGTFILYGVFYFKKGNIGETLFTAIPLILVLVPMLAFFYKKHGLKSAIAFPAMMAIAAIINNFINSLWISTTIAVVAVICYAILSDRSIRTSWSMTSAIRRNNPKKAINIGEKILSEGLEGTKAVNIKLNLMNAYFHLNNYDRVKEILATIDINKSPYSYRAAINFWHKKVNELNIL